VIISINWIKDYVDIPDISDAELAEKFTMATAEVEKIVVSNQHLKNISIVEIKAIKQHPGADNLNIVSFDTGNDIEKEVVCGAPNVKTGLKVPYAPAGTSLPDGTVLESRKIRGVLSNGMLCSDAELGLGEDASGLKELSSDAPVGTSMADYLTIKEDILLDIDNKAITHRPDLWGHYGMAREFSAIFGLPLKNPFTEEWTKSLEKSVTKEKSAILPVLKGESACLGYFCISVDNISIKDSPKWMKERLSSCGLRPINNIVDISNYVMLELGMPMHIFDRDLISGNQIVLRRMGKDDVFVTLDDVERALISTDTVVCDSEKPLVIAGIMGGKNSGVNETTSRILIETANWKDVEIRKTSARLGLRTDSSQRYEKSLDSRMLKRSALRALELVLELCPDARVVGKLEYDGENLKKHEPLKIDLEHSYVESLLGIKISPEAIVSNLTALDFRVIQKGNSYTVEVPSYRATKDIENKADIVEEIGRINGYYKISPIPPLSEVRAVQLSNAKKVHRKIQNFMVFRGKAFEIMTYPMVGEKLLKKARWHERNEGLKLLNPTSAEYDRMRPSIIPGILNVVNLNQKNFSSFRMFEIGRSYFNQDSCFSVEHNQLIAVFFDRKTSPYMDLANLMEGLLDYLNLSAKLLAPDPRHKNPVINREWPGIHPNENLDIHVMGKIQGGIITVHPVICREFKIKGNLAVSVLDLNGFENTMVKDKTRYKPLPKFPSSIFDCTVVTKPETRVEEILDTFKKIKIRELESCKVVGVFNPSETQKTVTLRIRFSDSNRTLPGDFLTEATDKIVKKLENAGYPLKK